MPQSKALTYFAAVGLGLMTDAVSGPAAAADVKQMFIDHCAACHGEDAQGVKDQGASLITSSFVKRSSDAVLVAFLKTGRQPDAPDSTMKLLMPAFDYFTDEELAELVAYARNPK